MLGLRPIDNNVKEADHNKNLKPNKLRSAKNKLKRSTNIKEGGQNSQPSNKSHEGLVSKPKPLQASTNTIHNQEQRLLSSRSHSNDKNTQQDDSLKKKTSSTSKLESKTNITSTLPEPKTDENDTGAFGTEFGESYDPLLDYCPFDEELYQKVLKLELADDGLPTYNSDEPFDF